MYNESVLGFSDQSSWSLVKGIHMTGFRRYSPYTKNAANIGLGNSMARQMWPGIRNSSCILSAKWKSIVLE